ncbi:MAG: signal peptidase I [Acidimicrobiales bacterium]
MSSAGPWPTPPSRVPPPDPDLAGAPAGPEQPPSKKRHVSGTRNLIEWVVIIVGALLVAFLVKTFLVQAFYIPSGSMLPTLQEQDRVLVNKLSYDLHGVERGDIVVFKGPEQAAGEVKDLIKRVIGLPGETVEAHDGKVFVDGREISEPYLGDGITTGPLEPTKVPSNHYWVMGDNRGNSKDSRYFGSIDESLIIGKAFVRVWPINSFRLF